MSSQKSLYKVFSFCVATCIYGNGGGGAAAAAAALRRPRTYSARLAPQSRGDRVQASASGKSEGSFWGGFLIGGTVFGVLGFLFAPQVSRMLLNSERMKKLLGDGNEDLEITREVLNDKISELNSAIDGVSAQLQSNIDEANSTPSN
mmetsp:Transcript_33266/g.71743  ORF Transcript_33266/g.71743 Transcript_33266/m.71743 type:complete len:147 (-) Transcript_33266:209-649(-)